MNSISFRKSSFFRYISFTVLVAFVGMLPSQPGYAQVTILMPPIGQMIHVTHHFEPPQMVGLKINLKDPFSFGFIMDQGQSPMSDSVKKEEFNKIVKYFLVSLAMPNKDMWVNLSPYESKRIIPEVFGQTEMGHDLLAQDYVLKQFTSSLMYPEEGLGKKFWDKVYQESQARFGTTDINVNTFNKVWIVADHADVYQKGDTAFLVGSHLKVMLEQDYMAIAQNKEQFGDTAALKGAGNDPKTQMASQIVREIIIPAIEKEVNDGESFAAVRQIYNAEIMATWFKKTLRASLLGQVFANKSKIAGQKVSDPQAKEKIFQQYLLAYKRGVFNYIKREATADGQMIPRRYLSGGMFPVSDQDGNGQSTVRTLTPDQVIAPSATEEATQEQALAGQLKEVQTPEFQDLVAKQFVSPPRVEDMIREIAERTQMSPGDRANVITGLVNNLMPSDQQLTDRQGLAAQLSEILSREHDTGEVMSTLADPMSRIDTSRPVAPAMAQAMADMPNLREPAQAAQLVVDLNDLPKAEAAAEVKDFSANEVPASDKALLAANVQNYLREQGVAADRINAATENIREMMRTGGVPTESSSRAAAELTQAGMSPSAVTQLSQGFVPAAVINQPVASGTGENDLLAANVERFLEQEGVATDQLRDAATAFRNLVHEGGTATPGTQAAVTVLQNAGVPDHIVTQLAQGQVPVAAVGNTDRLALVNTDFRETLPGKASIDFVNSGAQLRSAGVPEPIVTRLSQGYVPAAVINQPTTQEPADNPQLTANVEDFLREQKVATDQLRDAATAFQDMIRAAGEKTAKTESAAQVLRTAGVSEPVVTQLTQGFVPAVVVNQPAAANVEGYLRQEGVANQRINEAVTAFNDMVSAANVVKPENPGGINLSDEHLTMNIKVDGAGMPLPSQYQDKAMLNLNGLVSIIRSITPLTQQNVPALFELTK